MGRGLSTALMLFAAAAMALMDINGQAQSAPPAMNAKAARGAAIFQKNCISCHNKEPDNATPFGPPNLHGILSAKPMVTPAPTVAQVTETIRKGKSVMPPFGAVLTDAQISDLVAYLKVK